jgi:signal peptidase I
MEENRLINLTAITELFSKHPIFFKVSSGCMRPLVSKGDTVLVKSCQPDELKRGEIVLYRSGNNLFIHRFLGFKCDDIITKADTKFSENKPIPKEQVIGRVSLIKKKHFAICLESKIFKIISYFLFIFSKMQVKLYSLVKNSLFLKSNFKGLTFFCL